MSDLIRRADAIEAVRKKLQDWGSYAFEDYRRGLYEAQDILEELPSAEAVSMEEHVKELNDLAVEWKAKFAKAEKITDGIYDETMAKVAKECEECKERLRNIRQSAEAVHGEWVRKYDDKANCYWYECDQCGEYRPRNQFGHEYNANFCPNCGARMKGGDSE